MKSMKKEKHEMNMLKDKFPNFDELVTLVKKVTQPMSKNVWIEFIRVNYNVTQKDSLYLYDHIIKIGLLTYARDVMRTRVYIPDKCNIDPYNTPAILHLFDVPIYHHDINKNINKNMNNKWLT
jgi:hypothetical protein